jgi:hypothetical protein
MASRYAGKALFESSPDCIAASGDSIEADKTP